MRLFARLVFACCLAASVVPAALAPDEAPATAAQRVVSFSSEEGLARPVCSGANVDFAGLANRFFATKLVLVDAKTTGADSRRDDVVVNYQRTKVGQTGGAHISPLGACDAESDSVLVPGGCILVQSR